MNESTNNFLFNLSWFIKHQKGLLFLCNAPVIKYWFRWILRIHKDLPFHKKIVELQPNNYKWYEGLFLTKKGLRHIYKADFRTHNKFSKRIFNAFYLIWWLCHQWDILIANRLIPAWNLGFDTLTVYPNADADAGKTSLDGFCENTGAVWATVRDAVSGTANDLGASYSTYCTTDLNAGNYTITRPFFLFDTSSLGGGATISAAVASFAAQGGAKTNVDVTAMHLVASTPASNTDLVGDDYDQIGSVTFGNITIANWVITDGTYNDITLNADGRANINKTGISKFAGRLTLDKDNVAPTGNNYIGSGYFADQTGTDKDPKLVITYTPGETNMNFLNS